LNKICSLRGVDENGNTVIELNNVKDFNMEVIQDVIETFSAYGATAAKFTKTLSIMLSAIGNEIYVYANQKSEDALRPETEESIEIPNQKYDLEFFEQNAINDPIQTKDLEDRLKAITNDMLKDLN
jgi:hypothetical protein